jgi:hypothetical protein
VNWRRDLIRLWIIATIVWVAFSATELRVDRDISEYWQCRGEHFNLRCIPVQNPATLAPLVIDAKMVLLPPIVVALAGLALIWVARVK